MEIVQLEEKIYSMTELAEWFGIAYSSFRSRRDKKLEELRMFAEFTDLGRKGVKITKVKEPVYKKKGSKSRQVTIENIEAIARQAQNPTTYIGLANISIEIHQLPTSPATVARYVKEGVVENWGDPYHPNSSCRRVWGTKDDHGHYAYLTPEEMLYKQTLIQKTYQKDLINHLDELSEKMFEIDSQLAQKEITAIEAEAERAALMIRCSNSENNYLLVIKAFRERFHKYLINCLEIDLDKKIKNNLNFEDENPKLEKEQIEKKVNNMAGQIAELYGNFDGGEISHSELKEAIGEIIEKEIK